MDRSHDWMYEAQGDLEHARNDLQGRYYNWACFSAQQAAEKAVKAALQRIGAEAWGHSITDLLEELSRSYSLPGELIDLALELDKAYIPTRYPDAHQSGTARSRYTRKEAERLIEYASQVIQFSEGVLSKAE